MLFSSLEFLYLFLPLTAILYFICPVGKNHVLLVASLVFYGLAQPEYLPLMLAVCLVDYAAGLAVSVQMAKGHTRGADIAVTFAVASNILCLFIFKYLDALLSFAGVTPVGIELPPGISFYTFQAMSYVIDVRRRCAEAQKNPLTFITYVSLFPQLVAGPIVRYCEIDGALKKRSHSVAMCADGLRLFCVGLAKKMILANSAGEQWELLASYSKTAPSTLGAWLGVIFFAFQIYFDFSGYSDMARGLGRIFGFEFPENFRYPYIANSITDFWRRWHITLSSWFREYVYIPLGGNRRGKGRMYLNLFITWLLTGIWHGASFNFLLWGLYFFAILAMEKAFGLKLLQKLPSLLRHAYALFFILVGWLIFSCDGMLDASEGVRYLGQLFGIGCAGATNDALYELYRNLPLLLVMAIGSTPLPATLARRVAEKAPLTARALNCGLAVISLAVSTFYLADSGYNPFLYFRF
ncbi:MAG: MBOAT family protein [Clostridia bacterium]|nr:MBOAT family protein [Clostridia bacterium]